MADAGHPRFLHNSFCSTLCCIFTFPYWEKGSGEKKEKQLSRGQTGSMAKKFVNCHSKINLFRNFTIWHNVPVWELNLFFLSFITIYHHFQIKATVIFATLEFGLCFMGSLSIYHCFQIEATFILAPNAILCSMAKKDVSVILKIT
jgi:hypothetical protein